MKKPLLLVLTIIIFLSAQAQSVGKMIGRFFEKGDVEKRASAQMLVKQGNFEDALFLYKELVDTAQAKRVVGLEVDGDLLAEYAYTLALNHDFELALMYIDRSWALAAKNREFYTSNILHLMGHEDAALQFNQESEVPSWTKEFYKDFNNRYSVMGIIGTGNAENDMKRAYVLTANNQYIQAIALYEQLVRQNPSVAVLYINESAVWEKIGKLDYAATLLRKGLDLMPDNLMLSENRQIYETHLLKIESSSFKLTQPTWTQHLFGTDTPKLMIYGGAGLGASQYTFNARAGLYTSNRFSGSLNLGLTHANEQFAFSWGLAGYKVYHIFMFGIGINNQITKELNTWNLAPSVGITLMNETQTASYDITFSLNVPFSKERFLSYSITIGRTLYMNFNNK